MTLFFGCCFVLFVFLPTATNTCNDTGAAVPDGRGCWRDYIILTIVRSWKTLGTCISAEPRELLLSTHVYLTPVDFFSMTAWFACFQLSLQTWLLRAECKHAMKNKFSGYSCVDFCSIKICTCICKICMYLPHMGAWSSSVPESLHLVYIVSMGLIILSSRSQIMLHLRHVFRGWELTALDENHHSQG